MLNYHKHTSHSNRFTNFLDSSATAEQYAKRAVELSHKALSSAEHGYQSNYLRVWETAKEYGLKFLFGVEAYWVEDRKKPDSTNAHICVFARNESGRRQITKALSTANVDGFYHVPRLDFELFKTLNPKDVFLTSACCMHWGRVDRETQHMVWTPNIAEFVQALHEYFGDSYWLEVQAHNTPWQKEVNQRCIMLSDEWHIPLIAGLDSHYIFPEQEQERLWLREEKKIKFGEGDHEFERGVYEDYPDDATLVERFEKQGILTSSQIKDAMDATEVFMGFEDFEFPRNRKLPNIYKGLTQDERNQLYLKKVWNGWDEYKIDIPPEEYKRYEEAIREETDVVVSTNVSDYFLIDHEMVKRGKEKGGVITFSGRGSGSSYFTNTLLGFSTLDRLALPVTLYPARFISKERLAAGQLPDLDLNVADPTPFVEAQKELLGEGHVFPMIAYGTVKEKSAFRLLARAKNIPMEIQNSVCSQIEQYELEKKHAEEDEEVDLAEFVSEENYKYIEESKAYKGIVVSASQAPCGYLLYNDGDIREEIGIIRVSAKHSSKFEFCTVIDGYTADAFGYVKNDILTVLVVKTNALALKLAGLPMIKSRQLQELIKYDKATWDIFSNGYTMGINQCERTATRDKLMQYKPRELRDLSAFVAAIRPSFKSKLSMFLNYAKFSYGIPSLDKLLNNTDSSGSSWLLYQESMMLALNIFAGIPMDKTMAIIKGISRKDIKKIGKWKDAFLEGFANYVIEHDGFDKERADKTAKDAWQIIEDASSYGFNACVTGDTKIVRLGRQTTNYTIGQMHAIRESRLYAMRMEAYETSRKYKRLGFGQTFSLYDRDGKLWKNHIIDIQKKGTQTPVYRITVETGAGIKCNRMHKFPVPNGGMVYMRDLKIGDYLYLADLNKKHMNNTRPIITKIVSIEYVGLEPTYDVIMAAPAHNFVLENGLIVGNSHAVCVSIDALYGAYLKAHYPLYYYTALLTTTAEKANKDRIALIKEEMKRAFGIQVVPCRFRQDNRQFFIDEEHKTISDALSSVKDMSRVAAEELYKMKDMAFKSFVDLLNYLDTSTRINSAQTEVLIMSGYFQEFGPIDQLMGINKEYRGGESKFSKNHIVTTQAKRLDSLRKIEQEFKTGKRVVEPIHPAQQLKFEVDHFGTPLSIFPDETKLLTILEVDDKYSPKLKLYNASKGTVGIMKMRKEVWKNAGLKVGDSFILKDWTRKLAYHYVNGKSVKRPGVFDLWIEAYEPIEQITGEEND